ncbi:Leukocyte elastase inhibitor [Bulinus truncatus]|nr:Leukocyte elastase inhibitor [Bulinus truncatus]
MGVIFICVAVMMVTCQQLTNGDTSQQQLTLSAASSVFSQKLYQKVAVNKTEIVYSPYSIHSVLTMTYMGARGTTASEMAQVLGLNTVPSPHQAYHDLILDWNAEQLVKVLTCNAIFINPYEMILPSFIQQTNDLYLATADNLDLQEPEKAINVLVTNKTNNVIPEMLKPGTLDANTVLVLVNVLFFNGTWSSPFQKSLTQKQDFHQLGGATTQIDMMNDAERIKRIKRDDSKDVDVVELPFLGDRFSLYVALPRTVEGISELEAHITSSPANVQQMFEGLQSENFHLGLPKFKIETSLELNDVLSFLGMTTAFGPTADFSGINGSGGLYIDKVIHKAVIDVQETGTVAAAATMVSISKGFISTISAPVVADHPFVFFLRDNVNQQILFQGKFSG